MNIEHHQNDEITHCNNCNALIIGEDLQNRSPCEVCGSFTRIIEAECKEGINLSGLVGLKHKDPCFKTKHKYKYEESNRIQDTRTLGVGKVKRTIVIDRENDRYYELVVDLHNPNNIIHECEESLKSHFRHGSAKIRNN